MLSNIYEVQSSVLTVDTIVLRLSLRTRDSRQTFLNVTGNITVFDCTRYAKYVYFLSNRSQVVILNNPGSEPTNIRSFQECPSAGSSTFLLYINDLLRHVSSKVTL